MVLYEHFFFSSDNVLLLGSAHLMRPIFNQRFRTREKKKHAPKIIRKFNFIKSLGSSKKNNDFFEIYLPADREIFGSKMKWKVKYHVWKLFLLTISSFWFDQKATSSKFRKRTKAPRRKYLTLCVVWFICNLNFSAISCNIHKLCMLFENSCLLPLKNYQMIL